MDESKKKKWWKWTVAALWLLADIILCTLCVPTISTSCYFCNDQSKMNKWTNF